MQDGNGTLSVVNQFGRRWHGKADPQAHLIRGFMVLVTAP